MDIQGAEPAAGTYVGQYEIVRFIGAGGMGAVYEGLHPQLRKRVAIKVLNPAAARHPEARGRFLREGEAVARIRHPHVVDVTDMGFHDGQPFLVMELLEGEDLAAHLKERGPLPVAEAVDLMLPVLAAVAAGHEVGVIHRDLKPQNVILVRGDGGVLHPKVLDFGLAKLLDRSDGAALTVSREVMGTVAYMSPEQARGARDVDERTDQYALGLLLYECITGRPAFTGGSVLSVLRRIGDGGIEPPGQRVADLPPDFESVLMKAVELAAAGRYASVRAFAEALRPFAGAASIRIFVPAPVVDAPLPESRRRVHPWPWVALGAVVALGLGGMTAVQGRAPRPALTGVRAIPPPVITAPPVARPRTIRVAVRVTPPEAEVTLDGAVVGRGAIEREVLADGTPHILGVSAPGFEPQTILFANAPPPASLALTPLPRRPVPRPAPPAPPAPSPPKLGPNQAPIIFG